MSKKANKKKKPNILNVHKTITHPDALMSKVVPLSSSAPPTGDTAPIGGWDFRAQENGTLRRIAIGLDKFMDNGHFSWKKDKSTNYLRQKKE
jgi:hypothetical protein